MLARILGRLKPRPHTHEDRSNAEAFRVIATAREAIARGAEDEAEQLLRPIVVRSDAPAAQAQRVLGSLLGSRGRLAEARTLLETALAADPQHPEVLTDLGNVCRAAGREQEAASYYQRAIALDPTARTARFNLAAMRGHREGRAAAIESMRALLEVPAHAGALRTVVEWLCEDARGQDARELCVGVLRHEPGHAAAHAVMRSLLFRCDITPGEVFAHAEAARAAGLADPEIGLNHALGLQFLGRHREALASYDAAVDQYPDSVLLRFHRALALLAAGEFERAWADYELRLASRDLAPPLRSLELWSGQPLPDRTLLVYGEQGIGDEIMFASCIPQLIQRCPHVVLVCAGRLESLFRRSFPQVRVLSKDRTDNAAAEQALAAASIMTAIGSLPRHLRRTRADFPEHGGYLRADPDLVAHYRARLDALPRGLKVGFSWRGGSPQSRRLSRSLGPGEVDALLENPDVQFVNLQYDSRGDEPEIAAAIASGKLLHWPEALADYEHTAALICALDLTLSVCTAVIHLAGALGRSVLIMAPHCPEWRYGIAGEATPWYPSARILRQPEPGAWSPVIAAVHARLRAVSA